MHGACMKAQSGQRTFPSSDMSEVVTVGVVEGSLQGKLLSDYYGFVHSVIRSTLSQCGDKFYYDVMTKDKSRPNAR